MVILVFDAARDFGDGGLQLVRANDLERSIAGRTVGDERAARRRTDDGQCRWRRMRAALGAAGYVYLE
jgi:hypothetical protein